MPTRRSRPAKIRLSLLAVKLLLFVYPTALVHFHSVHRFMLIENEKFEPYYGVPSSPSSKVATDKQQQETASIPSFLSRKEELRQPTTLFTVSHTPALSLVDFMDMSELSQRKNDVFSAAWWQTTERFLSAKLEMIKNVEGDCFIPINFAGAGMEDARKTRDYLDFSIEHLSKWWKMTEAPGMKYAIDRLKSYIQRNVIKPESSIMNTTLALIPYGVEDKADESSKRMWKTSLSATIVSLIKQGVPRVVVVGTYETDAALTSQVFTELSMDRLEPSRQFETVLETTGTELAYVHTDDVDSYYTKINVPKGALFGLRDALKGEADPTPYLGTGDKERFEYVYMTEADQILNARLTTDFLDVLNDGRVIIPHRLQLIPHAQDVDQLPEQIKHFPHDPVKYLDADTDSCCDTGSHMEGHETICLGHWFQCGFGGKTAGDFSHLEDYEFISLTQGTGIVSLAATNQSRRCAPVQQSRGCPRPVVVDSVSVAK